MVVVRTLKPRPSTEHVPCRGCDIVWVTHMSGLCKDCRKGISFKQRKIRNLHRSYEGVYEAESQYRSAKLGELP